MDYKCIGEKFCNEINELLESHKMNASFVTGGGYAYDSIKYKSNDTKGDFDFMIVYDDYNTAKDLVFQLKQTNFKFEDKYLDMDLNLLKSNNIDIIRLSGNYEKIKSTINLVPVSLVSKICNFENELVIKKIAHNRNTSLFFAYGSDNSRIIVNFISPSFVTEDNEDHYIHLDFSHIEKNNNIYFGILADAILKGFNHNYDGLNFSYLRDVFLDNIHDYFKKNNICSSYYLNLFANNNYFPSYLRTQLISDFESRGKIDGKIMNTKSNEPIVFTTKFETNYQSNPFNFINNKEYNMSFKSYILQMQDTEYDRQYLLDAVGKFFGYILSSTSGTEELDEKDIISKIDVYGTNDLYFKDVTRYKKESIIDAFIKDLIKNQDNYNRELINCLLIISVKFLSNITSKDIDEIFESYNIKNLLGVQLDNKDMNINNILDTVSFNEIGTYHNYTSEVMSKYTNVECKFLNKMFSEQKDKKILDIMCGYGRIANLLKKFGYNKIYGIDSENYNFLNVPKDFTFINDDYLKHDFSQLFSFAYSLYNCYDSNEYLYSVLNKTHSVLDENGLFIVDCFNKSWRDEIDSKFEKVLYQDNDYTLLIKRDYDKHKGNENTWYELYYKGRKIKDYEYIQKFFSNNDILEVLDNDMWESDILNSSELQSRTNSQKHILVLRKK